MLKDAGDNTFSIRFIFYYGMNKEQLVLLNSFLAGQSDTAALTKGLQAISDRIAKDSSVKKIKID